MAVDYVQYWLELADYDLATAKDLQKSGRWIYVAFMCHQTIEKSLKAYLSYAKPKEVVPHIHNLLRLCEICELNELMTEEQQDFIDIMMPMNIEARYPSYKASIASSLNETVCIDIINKTELLQQWIKSKLLK